MATTPTFVTGWVAGNKKCRIVEIVFSGSYQDDGSESTITAAQCRLKKIEGLFVQSGGAAATALTTANPFAITLNAGGTSAEVTFYEDNAAAAAAPLTEKTDNEVFITGQSIRLLAIGY